MSIFIRGRASAMRKLAFVWPSEDEEKRFNTPSLDAEAVTGGCCTIPFIRVEGFNTSPFRAKSFIFIKIYLYFEEISKHPLDIIVFFL